MKIIRSDTLKIKTDIVQREALDNTLSVYQSYVRDLMRLINAQWYNLSKTKSNEVIKLVETMIHPTTKRPVVRHRYFHHCYYKFPSYLRRVAIMDATGQVRSFNTRYNKWLDGERKHDHEKPPTLICATNTFPSLYQGQCIKFNKDFSAAFIKTYYNNDWIWTSVQLKGKTRFLGDGKTMSPLLIKRSGKWELSLPTKLNKPSKDKKEFSGKILAVDVGINTAATCSVVDSFGTVHDRIFINRSDKDREYQLMQRIRSKAKKQTKHGNKLQSGFCTQDHRRLKQLAKNEANQISRKIVNAGIHSNCDAIALENLKNWRPKAGRKRSPMKARFHRWFHRLLVDKITSKSQEAGLRVITVFARGTSAYAYDGSGKVKRDKNNYTHALFASGKRYNADLSASYNIAARAIFKLYYPSLCKQQWSLGKPNACPTTGGPLVLSSIWLLNNHMAG